MSKPVHPIRKMGHDLCRGGWSDPAILERKLARHVRPLLDALEQVHEQCAPNAQPCNACQLLSCWRAKL